MSPAAVSYAGLTKRFGPKVAVAGVSAEIPAGSFFGICGPNGAGKTTLLRMTCGLLRPDAGKVAVAGHDVWSDPVGAKTRFGMVPDHPAMFTRLSGRELIEYNGYLRGMDPATIKDRTTNLLRLLDLEEAESKLVADFSLGMTKKVSIACALLHNPRVLFLDEPFAGIDPVARQVLEQTLDYYTRGGGLVYRHRVGDVRADGDCSAIWLWQLLLTRLSTRAPHSGVVREVAGASTIVPRFLAARPGSITATAGKELRYFRRDPRVRAQAIGLIVAMAAISIGAGRMLLGGPYAPFLATMVGWMVASTGFNQFGMDDRSFWAYLVSGVPMRRVVIGKNLALGLIGLPALVVVAVALAVISGNFSYLLPAVLAGLGVTGVWMAVGNVTSLLGAFPLPQSNLFGSRGASGAAVIASIGGLLAGGAVTVPIGLMVGLPAALVGPGAALVGALGWGIGAYWLGLRVASGLLDSRSLRLLEALDRPAV